MTGASSIPCLFCCKACSLAEVREVDEAMALPPSLPCELAATARRRRSLGIAASAVCRDASPCVIGQLLGASTANVVLQPMVADAGTRVQRCGD